MHKTLVGGEVYTTDGLKKSKTGHHIETCLDENDKIHHISIVKNTTEAHKVLKPAKPSSPPGSVFKGDPDMWEKDKHKIF